MDFFEEQHRARRRTGWLIVLFSLAVCGTVIAVYAALKIALYSALDVPFDQLPGRFWDGARFWRVAAYTVALIAKFGLKPRDVQWIPVGTDATARAVALTSGRADATLLTAPSYFPLEKQGYKTIANMGDYNDIYASTVFLFTRKFVNANPKVPELLIKAHAEAIKRFYDDKAFAVKAYQGQRFKLPVIGDMAEKQANS